MKYTLATPLKSLKFPFEVGNFWNEDLLGKYVQRYDGYSPFDRAEKLPTWEALIKSEKRICELFHYLSDFYSKETYEFRYKDTLDLQPSSFLSIQMLDVLSKEGLDITKTLLTTQAEDPQNTSGWQYDEYFNMYLQYLDFKGDLVPDSLLNQFISKTKEIKKHSSYRTVDEDVNTYFQILPVIPQNKITYEWFSEHLNLFCLIRDEDTRKLVNDCKSLSYDYQKKIYDYVTQHFPDHIEENKHYYSQILSPDIFSTKRLYQGSIDINLYQLMYQYNLKQKDFTHLCNIAKECLNVVAGSEFMQLINKDIPISNINDKVTHSNIKLNFSTDSQENLESFEKIVLTALNGVLQVSDKIRLSWNDSWHGEPELFTNMDAKFIHKYYLFHELNNTLDSGTTKPKRNKI